MVLLLLAMVIVIVQPYKVKFATYNTIDTILILLFAALYASIVCLNVMVQFLKVLPPHLRRHRCAVIVSDDHLQSDAQTTPIIDWKRARA